MKQLGNDNEVAINPFYRLIFMVIFFGMFGLVRAMIWLLVLYQFVTHLLTGRVNLRVRGWAAGLVGWTACMLQFMTYNSDRMPFPFHSIGIERD